ncbi:MAG: 2-C-methyl-D-erythritol 4-phosphate cytidylyltransferase [Chlamydiales bacterium]
MQKQVILLAGGQGTRMGRVIPKQFLPLDNKPIALFSFEVFWRMSDIDGITVVCEEEYRHLFQENFALSSKPSNTLTFALPGERRQDSVYQGFLKCANPSETLFCIHDSARPFIDADIVRHVCEEASANGAACVGIPLKYTIKEVDTEKLVIRTPDRSKMWEIQTPQVIRGDILEQGFAIAHAEDLTVTDDVSLAELIPHPVKMVEGSYRNIKITTPEDLVISEMMLQHV